MILQAVKKGEADTLTGLGVIAFHGPTNILIFRIADSLIVNMGGELGTQIGAEIAGKIVETAAGKLATKISGKLAAKGISGWVPLIGFAIGGGVNRWFVRRIAKSAREYYETKAMVAKGDFDFGPVV